MQDKRKMLAIKEEIVASISDIAESMAYYGNLTSRENLQAFILECKKRYRNAGILHYRLMESILYNSVLIRTLNKTSYKLVCKNVADEKIFADVKEINRQHKRKARFNMMSIDEIEPEHFLYNTLEIYSGKSR